MIDEASSAERSSALLRRWLAETHTPVAPGALRLTVGPLRLRTEVRHHSPTGAHGFGPIHAVDSADRPRATADPGLLAAACSAAAKARAVADAPINTAPGSLVDWALARDGEVDPAGMAADLSAVAESITDRAGAERWLDAHVDAELLPAVRALDPSRADTEEATASLLTRRSLGVVGVLGRRGVASEADLVSALVRRLRAAAEAEPNASWLIRHWLTSATLTDHAAVNGSGLRYQASGVLETPPVRYEMPNPLLDSHPPDSGPRTPGVPVPVLGGGWSLRPVEISGEGGPDVTLVHGWMNTEHVAASWGQAWSWRRWRDELADQLDGDHSIPCVVSRDGRAIAYVELYRVLRDALSRCYPYHPHDLGVHIAIGERTAIGRGLGSTLLRAVAEGLLAADHDCRRVVAEPDVHNAASIAAFRKAGYAREREVGLPGKNSALMVFSRPPDL